MSIFRLCENVPPVYPEGSRDFQLLCSLFDIVYGSTKFNIDTIPLMTDTLRCRGSLLPYLQHKLGLYLTQQIDDEALRIILKGFPYVIKKKGSKEGIKEMIHLFLASMHSHSGASLIVTNNSGLGDYIIDVGTDSKESLNVRLLTELLSYVVPTGYRITFSTLVGGSSSNTEVVDNDTITVYVVGDDELSKVASIDSSYDFVVRAGTTTVADWDASFTSSAGGNESATYSISNSQSSTIGNFTNRRVPKDED